MIRRGFGRRKQKTVVYRDQEALPLCSQESDLAEMQKRRCPDAAIMLSWDDSCQNEQDINLPSRQSFRRMVG
jgi:hypothetical protein